MFSSDPDPAPGGGNDAPPESSPAATDFNSKPTPPPASPPPAPPPPPKQEPPKTTAALEEPEDRVPEVGDTILVNLGNSDVRPGMVTRVWGRFTVNATIVLDVDDPIALRRDGLTIGKSSLSYHPQLSSAHTWRFKD